MIQGSDEWLQARAGRVTASRVADVMAKTKTGASASRVNYMAQLISERLTGQPADGFSSAAMRHGTETEPEARAAYEMLTGADVVEVGFIPHPTIDGFGASPDGLVGDDGLIEIKCPNTATHIETLLAEKVPSKYNTQMQVQMLCTDRAWCDFVSYDPRLPGDMRIWIRRVHRDDVFCGQIVAEVTKFLTEMDEKLDALKAKFGADDAN
jgi:putative phage-type endonuclease